MKFTTERDQANITAIKPFFYGIHKKWEYGKDLAVMTLTITKRDASGWERNTDSKVDVFRWFSRSYQPFKGHEVDQVGFNERFLRFTLQLKS